MDLRGSPSKKPATTSTIAMANVPSRQKEKRKQQYLKEEGVEVIDLCSSDDDTQAKVSFIPKPSCTVYVLVI
jgi:hypothetical protein